jgi:hypothetical protein
MNRELSTYFYDASKPGSYSSVEALWKACNKKYPKHKIRKWLESQDTYTLHKQRQINIKRQRYYVTNIGDLYQADLCDLRNLSKENDNYKFIITVIDAFSKKAWALPLMSKTSTHVIEALKKIFDERHPKKFQTDKGTEFVSRPVQKYLKDAGVKFFTSNQPAVKASICERFNRTLKSKMWKYFTYAGSYRYLDVLPKLVNTYNNSTHSSTGFAPNHVSESNILAVWKNLYGGHGRYNRLSLHSNEPDYFNVGDTVRIAKEKFTFEKGFTPNWTDETFKVSKVIKSYPITYEIADLKNEQVLGKFYKQELQKVFVNKETVFAIDKILESRGKGASRKLLVRWRGYSSKFDSWIKESDLIKK